MMLNGNGALDTSTYRLVNRVRDEIASHRLDPLRAQAVRGTDRGAPPPRAGAGSRSREGRADVSLPAGLSR